MSLFVGAAIWGCTERTIDEEARVHCTNVCEQARDCHFAPEDARSEQECIEDCIPYAEADRERCESSFKVSLCTAALSCEEVQEYTDALTSSVEEILGGDYPCGKENVAYLMQDCH